MDDTGTPHQSRAGKSWGGRMITEERIERLESLFLIHHPALIIQLDIIRTSAKAIIDIRRDLSLISTAIGGDSGQQILTESVDDLMTVFNKLNSKISQYETLLKQVPLPPDPSAA